MPDLIVQTHLGVSIVMGVLQTAWFIWENPIKRDDSPHLWHPRLVLVFEATYCWCFKPHLSCDRSPMFFLRLKSVSHQRSRRPGFCNPPGNAGSWSGALKTWQPATVVRIKSASLGMLELRIINSTTYFPVKQNAVRITGPQTFLSDLFKRSFCN